MDTPSLRSKASQDTLFSLLQLDPTPMDAVNTDKDLPPLPEQTEASASTSTPPLKSSTTSSIGLSGSGHGPIYYLMRIQRYSSYTFTFFASLHLATTSIIPLVAQSVPASESYLLLAREIYQTPLSEPLLVALPIAAHVGSGIALRLLRRAHNLRRYYHYYDNSGGEKHPLPLHPRHPLDVDQQPAAPTLAQGWPVFSYIAGSGYVFTGILAAHVFMNRALPLLVEGDSANIGLAYVAHGFVRHRVVSWFAYALLLAAGCGHMVWGWAKWLGSAQAAGWALERPTGNLVFDRATRKRRRTRLVVINAVAAVVAGVWAAGGLGIVARGGETLGWVGKLYDGLFEKVPGF